MPSLNNVLAALRREIEAALEENAAPNSRIRLRPHRVVLSLEFSVIEQRVPDGSVELSCDFCKTGASPNAEKTNSLTIEFKPVFQMPAPSAIKRAPARRKLDAPQKKLPQLDPAEAENVVQSLSSVFGAPGFDSSARATVFREVFAELSGQQAALLVASFTTGTVPEDDEELRNASHRINGILRTGPLRSIERASEVLAKAFDRHELEPVLLLIKEKWKTQSDWLAP
jgi:hypothetical protein